ncbi:MAG: sn-glycerol-3-phosphate ABC transporter ATP-binding protein UgpC [Planctomycetota bacterium]|nr:MAG: sn-glycerol-3-phosphate ABC transporter ATP-binding protein UgpC [Planctomycetota bacterium]
MAEVLLSDVWKVYPGGVEAVRGFNLDIADGEFVVLVGPSGCGKSTTLRMIAGLEEISRGTIRIGDRVVNDVHPKDRDIAMVFQNYALYPHMSVYKNMAFALKLRRVPKQEIDRRVRDAARILGIEHLLERKPRALSGGQRQRVAVGRAIVREPKAFLFDEPLSNLDAKLRVTTRGELKALHQRLRTTTVYVTHDQEEAMTLGDRVVVMADAEIQQVDTPFDVYRHPVNRFVAAFIGTPPMNFMDGTIEADDGQVVFREKGSDGAQALHLCEQHAPALRDHVGKHVVLGLRPQALRVCDEGEHDRLRGRVLKLSVEVVEPLGDEMDVRMKSAFHEGLVARIPSTSDVRPGQMRTFAVDLDRVHVFEPGEFGANLTSASQAQPVG